MVVMRKFLVLLCLLVGLIPHAFAQFDATVDKTSIASGRTLQLQLTLTGVKAKGDPKIDVLAQDFDILSQGKSSSFQFINGDSTRSVTWNYYLMPKRVGALSIPAISINTKKGMQSTQAIAVTVVAGAAPSLGQNPNAARRSDIWLEATVSDPNPYINQSVVYTLKVLRTVNVQNAELTVPEIDDAVFEQIGESTSTTEIRNGRRVNETTVTYLYTPLRAGKVTIPSVHLNTQIASTNRRGMFGGFFNYEPAVITGPVVEMKVQPAASSDTDWLPLTSLHLEEQWSGDDNATVGEPLTRTITVVADGTSGTQLPALSSDFGPEYKVYAERPETKRMLDSTGKKLLGLRKQVFSLIPLSAGDIEVPEVRLPWFNVTTGREEVAVMPARTLTVAPVAASSESPQVVRPLVPDATLPDTSNDMMRDQSAAVRGATLVRLGWHPALYFLAGVGCSGLLFGGVWFLQRRRAGRSTAAESENASADRIPQFRDLKKSLSTVASAKQLIAELSAFAHARWQVPDNAALKSIAQYFAESSPSQAETVQHLFQQLNAHLYAGADLELRHWCDEMTKFLATCSEQARAKNQRTNIVETLPPLNPKNS